MPKHPCCLIESNLEKDSKKNQKKDLTVHTCKVCGANHYELTIDNVVIQSPVAGV